MEWPLFYKWFFCFIIRFWSFVFLGEDKAETFSRIAALDYEFDEEDLSYSKLDEFTYVFEAKISLKDFLKVINLDDTTVFDSVKGEAETLAGLILEMTKKFPKRGQKISFQGFRFFIEELDQLRIKQVKVLLPKKSK